MPAPLGSFGLSSSAQRERFFLHLAASSLDTVRIHFVFGSDEFSRSIDGFSMKSLKVCPCACRSKVIRFRVMGLLRTFSRRVIQRRFLGRLLHLLVSMWSMTILGSGDYLMHSYTSPEHIACSAVFCSEGPDIIKFAWTTAFLWMSLHGTIVTYGVMALFKDTLLFLFENINLFHL